MHGKWPIFASLTAFVVIIFGKSFFGNNSEDEIAEFHAKYPEKDICLSAAAERLVPCSSPGCDRVVHMFLSRCLEQADGDKLQFCENAGSFLDSQGRDIFDTHCKPHSEYMSECEKIIGFANHYCSRIDKV